MTHARERVLKLAENRRLSNEPCAPLSKAEAVAWSDDLIVNIENGVELFEVTMSRLDDIRLFIEQHDHSIRAVYAATPHEEHQSPLRFPSPMTYLGLVTSSLPISACDNRRAIVRRLIIDAPHRRNFPRKPEGLPANQIALLPRAVAEHPAVCHHT